MMDWTDRHYRYFIRLLTRHTLLYTEMVTAHAVCRGDRQRLLGYTPEEKPLALQIGGCDPQLLADAAAIGADFGYDEINLNVGCPSERVQTGRFGACLMVEPTLVAASVAAMRARVTVPVTVKTRIGIDHHDSYEFLKQFIATVADAGCRVFIIHVRKAWLSGLSPKENRVVPPLRYDIAVRLKQDFPNLTIVLNGGIGDLQQAEQWLEQFDGVMIGRAAYHNPYLLAEADRRIFHDHQSPVSRNTILYALLPYMEYRMQLGDRLQSMTRHILGLYHGTPGARHFRRVLTEYVRAGASPGELFAAALPRAA